MKPRHKDRFGFRCQKPSCVTSLRFVRHFTTSGRLLGRATVKGENLSDSYRYPPTPVGKAKDLNLTYTKGVQGDQICTSNHPPIQG